MRKKCAYNVRKNCTTTTTTVAKRTQNKWMRLEYVCMFVQCMKSCIQHFHSTLYVKSRSTIGFKCFHDNNDDDNAEEDDVHDKLKNISHTHSKIQSTNSKIPKCKCFIAIHVGSNTEKIREQPQNVMTFVVVVFTV